MTPATAAVTNAGTVIDGFTAANRQHVDQPVHPTNAAEPHSAMIAKLEELNLATLPTADYTDAKGRLFGAESSRRKTLSTFWRIVMASNTSVQADQESAILEISNGDLKWVDDADHRAFEAAASRLLAKSGADALTVSRGLNAPNSATKRALFVDLSTAP